MGIEKAIARMRTYYKTGDHQVLKQMKAMVDADSQDDLFLITGSDFIRFFIKSMRYNRRYFVCTMNLLTHGYHYFKMREMIMRVPPAAG